MGGRGMNEQAGKKTAIMALVISILALFASIVGVFSKTLYEDVYQAGTIPKSLVWGSKAQDIVSIIVAVFLAEEN
jgi:uncharacterized membrane protein